MNDIFSYRVLPENYKNINSSFKIILVGDSGVGKSCITSKATRDEFQEYYNTTIGFEFATFNIKIHDTVIRLQIWDTCGQEMYRSLIASFYQACGVAILVYSIDNRDTFKSIPFWIKEIKNQAHPDIKMVLIGNKIDLENKREVTTQEGENFAKENEAVKFMETSAKTGTNTQELFIEVAMMLYKEQKKYEEMGQPLNYGRISSSSDNSKLQPKPTEKDKEGKCAC